MAWCGADYRVHLQLWGGPSTQKKDPPIPDTPKAFFRSLIGRRIPASPRHIHKGSSVASFEESAPALTSVQLFLDGGETLGMAQTRLVKVDQPPDVSLAKEVVVVRLQDELVCGLEDKGLLDLHQHSLTHRGHDLQGAWGVGDHGLG